MICFAQFPQGVGNGSRGYQERRLARSLHSIRRILENWRFLVLACVFAGAVLARLFGVTVTRPFLTYVTLAVVTVQLIVLARFRIRQKSDLFLVIALLSPFLGIGVGEVLVRLGIEPGGSAEPSFASVGDRAAQRELQNQASIAVGFEDAVMPMRAWELLMGALLATFIGSYPEIRAQLGRSRGWVRRATIACGYGFILLSALVYTPTTPFPNFAALLPTAGALLAILGSLVSTDHPYPPLPAEPKFFPFLSFFGTISYALYLWHWPVLISGKFLVAKSLPVWILLLLMMLSIVLASLSTFLVELPIQRGEFETSRLVRFATTWWATLLGIGLVFYLSDGLPQRIGAETASQQSVLNESWIWITNRECLETYDFTLANSLPWWFCWSESGDDSQRIALVGSSLMNQLTPGFVANGDLSSHSVLSLGTCPVLWHQSRDPKFDHPNPCALEYREAQEDFLEKTFLENPVEILLVEGVLDNEETEDTVERFREIQAWSHQIIVVKYFRIPNLSPQDCLSRPISSVFGPNTCSVPIDYWNQQEAGWAELEGALVGEFPDLKIFDPNSAYCDKESCSFVVGEKPVMRDSIHLSTFGSDLVAAKFVQWAKSNLPEAVHLNHDTDH